MKEQDLLDALQFDFPLTQRPYACLAQRLGVRPEVILESGRALLDRGVLRSIRGFFDAKRLDHHSTLVAAHIPDADLETVAARVSSHPGVSHNYAREHFYNLWFTLTIPVSMETDKVVTGLLDGVDEYLLLPAIRTFKIDSRFTMGRNCSRMRQVPLEPDGVAAQRAEEAGEGLPMTGKSENTGDPDASLGSPHEPFEPSPTDRRVVYVLSQSLPIVELPFALLAQQYELTERCLLEKAQYYLERGIMRRYGATVNHRRVGFAANGMTGWVVPPESVDAVGRLFARVPQVSHCYERRTYPEWPYNLFTMVHGATRDEVETVVQEMARTSGIDNYAILFSTAEFKKAAVSYFDPSMYD